MSHSPVPLLYQATLVLLFSRLKKEVGTDSLVWLPQQTELACLDVNTSKWYYTTKGESKTRKAVSLVAQCCAFSAFSVSTSRDAHIKNQIQETPKARFGCK